MYTQIKKLQDKYRIYNSYCVHSSIAFFMKQARAAYAEANGIVVTLRKFLLVK